MLANENLRLRLPTLRAYAKLVHMSETPKPFPLPAVPPKFSTTNAPEQNRKFAAKLYQDFFNFPISRARKILETTSAQEWEQEGQKRALKVFHEAAERVPAYKDFLKKNKIDHRRIETAADLQSVPWIDKENYLKLYPLSSLHWDGIINTTQITAVSSGSSGEPFFWPRGTLLEIETTFSFELFLSNILKNERASTLFVNSQSMGMYIGGPFTLNAVLRIAQKGNPINIVTPGITIEDVLEVISRLKDSFDQLVIAAYPPFAMDIINVGIERGIDWTKKPVKFVLFGESYSESWRDHISELTGITKPETSFINCFGTADAAIIGHETPYTIALRQALDHQPKMHKKIFGEDRLPSLMQYHPTLRYLELIDKELLLTFGSGGIPLVRYNLHDRGGIIPYTHSRDLFDEVTGDAVEKSAWQLPTVYVFGKSDFTATIYGLNVYPENIKTALMNKDIKSKVSGKFQMSTEYRRRTHNQYLLIRVELAPGIKASTKLRQIVRHAIVDTLKTNNAEYRKLYEGIGRKATPDVRLHHWGDSRYFTVGTKQKWKH